MNFSISALELGLQACTAVKTRFDDKLCHFFLNSLFLCVIAYLPCLEVFVREVRISLKPQTLQHLIRTHSLLSGRDLQQCEHRGMLGYRTLDTHSIPK